MTTRLRLLALVLAAAGGLTTAPTQGADGTLSREQPASLLPETQTWSLRPTKVAAVAGSAAGPNALADLPDARRSVRVVYQGYLEAGPLRSAR